MADLRTKYLGLTLNSPIIAASSGLTHSVNDIKQLASFGAGAVVLKSLFEEEIRIELEKDQKRMVSDRFIYPETIDFYDDLDDVEDTLTSYLKLIRDAKKAVNIPVIASINCVTSEKWPYFAETLQDAGADALELNIFVLPSDFSHTAQENEELYFNIVREVKKRISIPLGLKISYYSSNLGSLIQRLSQTGIAGITLFNRFYSPDIDIRNFEVVPSHVYSSPGDITIPLRWIAIMAERVSCSLAASTGIHDAEGVIKQLLAGADAVQVASTLYKHGLQQVKTMNEGLNTWMDDQGLKSIQEFKGRLSQSKVNNPAAYERVQFMKHFSGKKGS